jgi:hypothetical protein
MNFSKSCRLAVNLNEQLVRSLVSPYDEEIREVRASLDDLAEQYHAEVGIFRHCETRNDTDALFNLKYSEIEQRLAGLRIKRRAWMEM